MYGDRKGYELSTRSAIYVIGCIEDPLGNLEPADRITYGEDIAEVCASKKAEELIGYIERGEIIIPPELKERAARAIIQYRTER